MQANSDPESRAAPRRALYGWAVVAVLVLASVVSYVDRQVVAIVVAPMKSDLGAGATEVGLLYGIFALFYAIAAVPIAMLGLWSSSVVLQKFLPVPPTASTRALMAGRPGVTCRRSLWSANRSK